ncbi:HAD-like protein [Saitoella complicata NRRL Y-17804]|uniref:HAD-like protein n=1 Tax=Saitoella complicata (strain BCRC 22490 / CBS 7301 / JCM 7358 / NBRC 10748 / NRRL Y-17804) TaxID=698492 RepID=UPI00086793D9|nr:HAD-like protein [Saitoella complicata NRRL Y-17804]ODQ54604.1 HAD-like protein [Saitoella complicata NRRL Y-17804]
MYPLWTNTVHSRLERMRQALKIAPAIDILDHIHSLPQPEQSEAEEAIRSIERRAMQEMKAQPGLRELFAFLEHQGIPKAICTRNFPVPTNHLISTFLGGLDVSPVVTREFRPPKPHPAPILHIAEHWNVDPQAVIMVGDSADDLEAGKRAGAATVLLLSDVNGHLKDTADVVIASLTELIQVLENGF